MTSIKIIMPDEDFSDAMKIRIPVFVHEQKVPQEHELDDNDKISYHAVLYEDEIPVACGRLYFTADDAHIGRVAVLKQYRRKGYATEICRKLIDLAISLNKADIITLDAQTYAIGLYKKLGFKVIGKEFLDENIPHFKMELELKKTRIKKSILFIPLIFTVVLIFIIIQIFNTKNTVENIDKYLARDMAYYAKTGDVESQYNYAECYYNGFGVTQDYEQAVYWFTKAAGQEHAAAQYLLSTCYFDGLGVERDIEHGFYWRIKSAEQGYAEAQFWLGILYYFDNIPGVYDYEKAVYWFEEAAKQGHEEAIRLLKTIRE